MTPISKHFLASLCRLSFALTTAVRCLRKLSQTAVPPRTPHVARWIHSHVTNHKSGPSCLINNAYAPTACPRHLARHCECFTV